MATFSYDPAAIHDGSVNQMRFELGDVYTGKEGTAAVLCDEEYLAIISEAKNWRTAKYHCLCAIINRLAYQTDSYSAGGMSFNNSGRYDRLMALKKKMEAGMQAPSSVETSGELEGAKDRHYFTLGMHDNVAAGYLGDHALGEE